MIPHLATRVVRSTPLLIALLSALASSQTYRVAGIVLSATEGHPLSRARVTLADQRTGKALATMLTSDDGRFEFLNVPPGKYPLNGTKRGYQPTSYNQHENFSTAIVTGAGVDTEHLTLRMAPLAQIYGQVLDEHGDPVRKARVNLWRDDHSSGVSRTQRSSQDTTDDLGAFELSSLSPGTYFLSVTAEPWFAVHPKADAFDVDRSLDVVYPTTYYSGATESEDATPILVKGGDHLQIDLHLLPVAPIHMIFHTPTSEGIYSTPMLFKRVFDDLDFPDRQQGQMVGKNEFEIVAAPGHYRVSLAAAANSPARSADLDLTGDRQEVDIAGGEVLSTLTLTPEIPGASQLPSPLIFSLRDSKGHHAGNAMVNRTPTFTEKNLGTNGGQNEEKNEAANAIFRDLPPGHYTISAFGGNQPFSVSSVAPMLAENARGKPLAKNSIDIPAGSNLSFAITLVAGSANIAGFVQRNGKPFDGAMVVLVPEQPESHIEFFRRDQSDLDGSFGLPNVVPGRYTVVAIEDGWDLDWSQPGTIARYAAHGEKITVSATNTAIQLPAPVELQSK